MTDDEKIGAAAINHRNYECAHENYYSFKMGVAWRDKNPSPEVVGLASAAQALRNEVKGTLHAHELAIRYDHGNSNWECLELAIELVEKALAAYNRAIKMEEVE